MADFIDENGDDHDLCTFSLSNSNLIPQAIYVCKTCGIEGSNTCCCDGCSKYCHIGHDVEYFGFGKAYCDCGHGLCSLQAKSEVARRRLGLRLDGMLFDDDMRIFGTIKSELNIPQCSSYSSNINVNLRKLLYDQSRELIKLSKDTFWMSHNQSPRCALERTAKQIYDFHTSSATQFDHSTSGLEWWVQIKDPKQVTDEFQSAIPTGVDLHYDKDEEIASTFGVGIFPQISTITYLSEPRNGIDNAFAPTIIVDVNHSLPLETSIRKCFVSHPRAGKHVAFDGSLLHGAPSVLSNLLKDDEHEWLDEPLSSTSQLRVTLLVNIWLNYHPANVHPLPDEILHAVEATTTLSKCESDVFNFTISSQSELPIININGGISCNDTEAGEWIDIPFVSNKSQWGKGADEAGIHLHIWMPKLPVSELQQQIEMKITKVSTKAKKSSDVKLKSGPVNKTIDGGVGTYLLRFCDEYSFAQLEYEDDEEEGEGEDGSGSNGLEKV